MDPATLSFFIHFLFVFVLVVMLTTIFGRKYLWLAILFVFLIGFGKEVRDLFVNPWHMSMIDLWRDSLWDFISNQMGIAAAGVCLKRLLEE